MEDSGPISKYSGTGYMIFINDSRCGELINDDTIFDEKSETCAADVLLNQNRRFHVCSNGTIQEIPQIKTTQESTIIGSKLFIYVLKGKFTPIQRYYLIRIVKTNNHY